MEHKHKVLDYKDFTTPDQVTKFINTKGYQLVTINMTTVITAWFYRPIEEGDIMLVLWTTSGFSPATKVRVIENIPRSKYIKVQSLDGTKQARIEEKNLLISTGD